MEWINKCNESARKLSKEKRQQFIDLMWSGKTVGEATKECGITDDEATGIMNINIVSRKFLNTESV